MTHKEETTRLLQSSIAKEDNKKLRTEFNVTQDLALQIVGLKREIVKYRTALVQIAFSDDLQTAVGVADKVLK
jgi:hypothetical protein